jgi:hypothetical protein
MYRFYLDEGAMPLLKGAVLMRGDSISLQLMIVEEGQEGASFRFTAKAASQYPNGVPLIVKNNADFTINVVGNVLRGEFEILSEETSFVTERITLIYDLERTIGTGSIRKVKTIEQGKFSIVPDVAI